MNQPIHIVREIADALLHLTPELGSIPQCSVLHGRLQTIQCHDPQKGKLQSILPAVEDGPHQPSYQTGRHDLE